MKGRAKDRDLLSQIRTEFENEANIVHKYGKSDDEFFFVIGYVKPDVRLDDISFRIELEQCINKRRQNLNLALRVDSVKVVMYKMYSLAPEACLWESKELKLGEQPEFSQSNLLDTAHQIIELHKFEDHEEAM